MSSDEFQTASACSGTIVSLADNGAVSDPATPEKLRSLSAQVEAGFSGRDYQHDVDRAARRGSRAGESFLFVVRKNGDELTGFAPFHVFSSHLEYNLGNLRLFRKSITCYEIDGPPISNGEDAGALAAETLDVMAADMADDAVISCRSIPTGTPFHDLLNDRSSPVRKRFHVLPWGPEKSRFKIVWTGDFEAYLSTLGKISRKDLRRTMKKFERDFGSRYELRRYTAPEQVKDYLRDAVPVSDLTYQKQLLGIGLSDDPGLESDLEAAARRGLFLAHNLYVDGQPIAFHHGFVYNKIFVMVDGGYDPEWRKSQVGVVSFLMVLQDIERNRDDIELMDYLSGYNVLKERTSNWSQPERDYFLFKKNFAGSMVYRSLVAMNAVSDGLVNLLKRVRADEWAKTVIRRWTGRGHV